MTLIYNANTGMEQEASCWSDLCTGLLDVTIPTHNLSVGQRQAVTIARAISTTNLKILVMDEPTAALGPRRPGTASR